MFLRLALNISIQIAVGWQQGPVGNHSGLWQLQDLIYFPSASCPFRTCRDDKVHFLALAWLEISAPIFSFQELFPPHESLLILFVFPDVFTSPYHVLYSIFSTQVLSFYSNIIILILQWSKHRNRLFFCSKVPLQNHRNSVAKEDKWLYKIKQHSLTLFFSPTCLHCILKVWRGEKEKDA